MYDAYQEQAEKKVSALEGRLKEMDRQLIESQRIAKRAQDGLRLRNNMNTEVMKQNSATTARLNVREAELESIAEDLRAREQELLHPNAGVGPAANFLDGGVEEGVKTEWRMDTLRNSLRSEAAEIERVKEERAAQKSELLTQQSTVMDLSERLQSSQEAVDDLVTELVEADKAKDAILSEALDSRQEAEARRE